jgi:chemotaxis protein methyltransferase CheR
MAPPSQLVDAYSEDFTDFLAFLKDQLELDFTQYARASSALRINMIMERMDAPTLEILKEKLLNYPLLRQEFIHRFTVNVTEMFRDPLFFKGLRELAFPSWNQQSTLRIWSAGCSSGEELFSLAILLEEAGLLHKATFLGTDLNQEILEVARKGEVAANKWKEAEEGYLSAGGTQSLTDYFKPFGGKYYLNESVLEKMQWEYQDMTKQRPEGHFDLVLCRNVFIYFNPVLQNTAFQNLLAAIGPNGYLGIGSKESLVFCRGREQLLEIDPKGILFRRHG